MNYLHFSIQSISKTIILIGVFALSLFTATDAYAGTVQMRVKNNTNPTYSSGSTYASAVRAEPGDELGFRMLFLGDTAANKITVDFPANVSFVTGSTATVSGNTATATVVDSDTVEWNFNSGTTEIISFNATVAAGNVFTGTNHSIGVSFSTDGTPASSDTATITVGPIVTSITPSTGNNLSPVSITSITGHGFTGTTAVALSDGTSLDLTGATITNTSISGPNLRVSASHTPGAYWVLVTVTSSGNTLVTNSDSTETVQYTATDGIAPQMATGSNSYIHSTGILTLNFDETIDVSATNVAKITLADASSGGNSLTLDASTTVSATDSTAVTFTLTQSDRNTVSNWGQSVNTLYVHINGDGIYDLSANPLSNQGSRTALDTWTEDTTQPTAAITYTQNSATITSAKTGAVTITITFSEPIATTPQIAINQQGTTDISATNLTGSGTTWTYTYTIVEDDGGVGAYVDGVATITISNVTDYAGLTLASTSNATLTIDTLVPSPAITTLSGTASGQTGANFSWTPTYSASDFSTYKFYWSTSSGVTSSNGTLISKNSSGYSNLGTSSTNTLSLSGLSAGTNYYAVIYICDASDNCSLMSNEATLQTQQNAVVTAPVSGGGGGGGGSSAPSTTSSAKTVSSSGGSFSTNLPSGASAAVTVPSGVFTDSTTIAVSEATSSQIAGAPLPFSVGSVIGSSIVSIVANSSGVAVTQFSQPISLSFTYTDSQLGTHDSSKLRVAFFNETTNEWVALNSVVNAGTRTVTAETDHFTLFSLISFVNPPSTVAEDTSTPTEEPQGQILGFSIGVYPNGTLLKAPDSPAVWYLEDDEKHLIRSASIFESRFNWNDIITLPSGRQIDLYKQGEDVKFGVGTLVKVIGEPAVYRVSITEGVQPIESEEVFFGRGYSFSKVIEVEQGSLDNYTVQAVISDSRVLSGDLVKLIDASAVYFIQNNEARLIPSASIFRERAYKFSAIRTITEEQFASLASGIAMSYPGGTLVKGDSSAVYVISEGARRAITSGADFEALLYKWENIVDVPEILLAAIPESASIKLVQEDVTTALAE